MKKTKLNNANLVFILKIGMMDLKYKILQLTTWLIYTHGCVQKKTGVRKRDMGKKKITEASRNSEQCAVRRMGSLRCDAS